MKSRQRVSALVPVKLRSRRLPNKNFLMLGGHPLAWYIFDTLTRLQCVDQVFCYSSVSEILELLPKGVSLLPRPSRLDGDDVKARELFSYAIERIDADVIVICHATSPFVSTGSLQTGIEAVLSGKSDSAFSVAPVKSYCWFNNAPLNHDPQSLLQTQELIPIYAETSGFYVFRKEVFMDTGSRIGSDPLMVELDFREAVDIDDPRDFDLARLVCQDIQDSPKHSLDASMVDFIERVEKQTVKHIAFDLDGVLIDSKKVMEEAWERVNSEEKLKISFEEYSSGIGLPFDQILHSLDIPQSRWAKIKKLYESTAGDLVDKIILFPGVQEGLKKLYECGYRMTICTSKDRSRTRAILRHFEITDYFVGVVTPDDLPQGRGKPNPDALLRCCLSAEVSPIETVFVGDMESDRKTAENAGITFVSATWGIGDIQVSKHLWFREFTDLVAFFE